MPTFNFAPYQPASYCAHKEQPGNVYLALFIEAVFPETRLLNIEACRDIVGGDALSHHAEGRANDEGVPQTRQPSGVSVGEQIVRLLGPHGKVLGIDHIIGNLAPWLSGRGQPRTWANAYPFGKIYNGLHPHKDHDHIGLTRLGARDNTLDKYYEVVFGAPDPIPPPVPQPPLQFGDIVLPLVYKPKVVSQDVALLQDLINETYYPVGEPGLTTDGRYGNGTAAAVRKWLVPQTGDTNPEVLNGHQVNFRMWRELQRDWVQKITR